MDLSSEPLAWAVTAIVALLKLVDVARAKARSAERQADRDRIDAALTSSASANQEVVAAKLEAAVEDKDLLRQIHAAAVQAEQLKARLSALEADVGHARDDIERVRRTVVSQELFDERSERQDDMLRRIEKRVGGSGMMSRPVTPRSESLSSDPPPMRPRVPSRR